MAQNITLCTNFIKNLHLSDLWKYAHGRFRWKVKASSICYGTLL